MDRKELEGTSALNFSQIFEDMKEVQEEKTSVPDRDDKKNNVLDNKKVRSVLISSVTPDPNQPRKNITPDSSDIKELAESIKKHGFINFITIREHGEQNYIIVAGERRYWAAKMAGLERIPAFVIAKEQSAEEYALVQLEENLQREDLTYFEEADAYERLIKEFGLQQKDIVEKMKKDKGYISKMLRLSKISKDVRKEIESFKMAVSRDVLWDLASFSENEQKTVWEKIKHDPTSTSLKKVVKASEKIEEKEELKNEENVDPDQVWEALKKAIKVDKSKIFAYISKKKAKKLLDEFLE